MAYELEGIRQLDIDELKEQYNNGKKTPIMIDIREPGEYEERHIPGVPLLPMNQVPEVIDQFKKDESYVFICRSGSRSQHTAQYFQDNGIENVYNFAGGMLAWDEETNSGMENPLKDVNDLYKK